jgi:hypothetical protein
MQITEDAAKENGVNLGTVVAENIRKRLNSDLQSIAVSIFHSFLFQKKKKKVYFYHHKALPAISLTF